jgi:hypothetical protein
MVVICGSNWKGEKCVYFLNNYLRRTLDDIKKVVSKKDFDYVALVCGMPGLGKSNFSINCCKYLDNNFTIDNICFTADDFIEKSTNMNKGSAIMLDESFASLNSRISNTTEFLRILNHIQIIRQKNLYIFLCLPNFFDLQKSIAIYRSRHLFVVYAEKFGDRGRFVAFGFDEKKDLYIKGLKFMNYNCVSANYSGTFCKQKAINEVDYINRKHLHLQQMDLKLGRSKTKIHNQRDILINYLHNDCNTSLKLISDMIKLSIPNLYRIIQNQRQ